MAVHYSDQLQKSRNTPVEFNREQDQHGKLRCEYFKFTAPAGGVSAGDEIELATLVRGRVRVLGNLSRIHIDQATGSPTVDIGYRAFETPDGTEVAADPDGFDADLDPSSGAVDANLLTALDQPRTWAAESRKGITVFATVESAALDADDVIEGYIVYMAY